MAKELSYRVVNFSESSLDYGIIRILITNELEQYWWRYWLGGFDPEVIL